MPPEQLGEERLEEDEVDDEDLATGDGPGLRERSGSAQHSGLRGTEAAREGRLTRPLILQPTETQKANTTP